MIRLRLSIGITVLLLLAILRSIPAVAQDGVPPLVQISGDLVDQNGKGLSGSQTVTFALYKEQSGDAPLWVEVQVVTADAKGHFVALLGSASRAGLPLDLFSTGQARFLSMQAAGYPEQPRTFLASVPYALAPLSALSTGSQASGNSVLSGAVPRASSLTALPGAAPAVAPATVPRPIISIVTDADSGLQGTNDGGGTFTLSLVTTCAAGQLLKWSGTAWGCTADTDVKIGVTGGGMNVLANATSPNIVGGYGGNAVASGAAGATIAGGGESRVNGSGICLPGVNCQAGNRVTQSFGTVGGGENNQAGDAAGSPGVRSFSTVGGGFSNTASGLYSTVPGGLQNAATGVFSFAAGRGAKANHDGTFVWGDNSTVSSFASTAANQFLLRANGGVGINTNAPIATLDVRGDLNLQDATNAGVVRFPSNGGLFFRDNVNNLDRMFISGSTGRVGIGTTSPSQLLDVSGNANVEGTMNAGTVTATIVTAAGPVTGRSVIATDSVKGSQLCIGTDCRSEWPATGFNLGGGLQGSGPNFHLARWINGQLGDSSVSDQGSVVSILLASGAGGFSVLQPDVSSPDPTLPLDVPSTPNIVGGSSLNSVSPNVAGATISGGGQAVIVNVDPSSAQGSLDGANTVTASFGTIGGGQGNSAGQMGVVAGGSNNVASGFASAVPGGVSNAASGAFSFAAGGGARANHNGTFVWADQEDPNTEVPFNSTGSNQFLIRASGGVGIGTNSPTQALDVNGTVKANGICIGADCRTAWPSGGATGTITGVTAGTGLTGGGTSGSVSLGVDFAATQKRVAGACATGNAIQAVNGDGSVGCVAVGGGIGGSGSQNSIAKFGSGGVTVGNSRITDDGTTIALGDDASGRMTLLGGASGIPSIIAGFKNNSGTTPDGQRAKGVTIAGGGQPGAQNQVTGDFGTVGGGTGNTAGELATVAGGELNVASGVSSFAAGDRAQATGAFSTVGGGSSNTASGENATVPGGALNIAAGPSSFAAGFQAKASHQSTFVWNDGLGTFESTAPFQFLIQAIGGVGIGTNAPTQALDVVGNVKADGLCIGTDCRTAWPSGSGGGSITGVTATSGLTGGGTSGNVSLAVDFAATQKRVANGCAGSNAIQTVNGDGTVVCVAVSSGIGGSGTLNLMPRFVAPNVIGNSQISDDGTNVVIGSNGGYRVLADPFSPNLVAGFVGNDIAAGVNGATIGGGGRPDAPNRVLVFAGVVGGGAANQAGDEPFGVGSYATVAGGLANTAGGGNSTVGGGYFDRATGNFSTIGGGYANTASGDFSTVPGGDNNVASGAASFAAGWTAKAVTDGSFVWGDYTSGGAFASTAPNQFLIRASGGVGIGTNAPTQTVDVVGNVKADGLCIGADCRTAWPSGNGDGTITGVTATSGLTGGGTSGSVSLGIASSGVTNAMLQNSAVTLNAGLGLSGGGAVPLGGSSALSVDFATTQKRVTGNCAIGNAIQTVNDDGTVRCIPVGSSGIGGSGTTNSVPKFTAANTLASSQIFDDEIGVSILVGDDGSGGATGGLQVLGSAVSPPIVGGYVNNSATTGGTVGGGGAQGMENWVFDEWGTIAGGLNNRAGLADATNGQTGATVGGGMSNTASNVGATVIGGQNNVASGAFAVVAGGTNNRAAADTSFAAGNQAKANHAGAFVWADSFQVDFGSSAANQFNVRASGGVRIFSNQTLTAGVSLAPGAGSWSTVSDKNAKENFARVDGGTLLKKLNEMAFQTWSYKSQDASIRHMGPMAQDFYAAFGLGEDDKHISTVDADGVALAGVQALYRMLLQKDEELAQQRKELQSLATQIETLRAAINHMTPRDNEKSPRR